MILSVKVIGQEKSDREIRIERHEQTINNPESHDTAVANAWRHLAEELYVWNIDTIIPLCERSLQIAKDALPKYESTAIRLQLRTTISACYNNIGYAHLINGKLDLSIENFMLGLEIQIAIGDLEGAAISLNNIGQAYDRKGELEKALNYYHESMMIQERIGDQRGLAISLNNIAIIYKNQGNVEKALEYYQLSYEIRKELNNEIGMAGSLNNIGTLYYHQEEYEVALMYYQRSIDIRKKLGDKRGIAHTLHNTGGVYYDIGEYENALDCFNESLEIRKELNIVDGIAESQVDVAKVYFAQGYIQQAKLLVEEALDTFQSLGFPKEIGVASGLLAEIYEAEHRNKEALKMYKLSNQMLDSLANNELQRAVLTQQARYTYEKQKAQDDAEHEKELVIKEEEKRIREITMIATAGGLILLATFLIFVFNRLRITRNQRDEISTQKKEIETKNKEITDSINYAKRIQSAILPSDEKIDSLLGEVFVYYQPKDIVAGDFYWLEDTEDRVFLAVADCTGHGVPGAMVSVVCNNGLNRAVREFGLRDTGEILDKTRELVVAEFEASKEEVKDGMDIALISIQKNENETTLLNYSGAHNPLWIIRNGMNEIEEIKGDKQPIGRYDLTSPFKSHQVELNKGDQLYIFSDGYADQFGGPERKKFKTKNFKDLLLRNRELSLEEQHKQIEQEMIKWMGDVFQIDDYCIIGLRC